MPIETTGLLGGSTTTSAVRIASRTPGAAVASRCRARGTAAPAPLRAAGPTTPGSGPRAARRPSGRGSSTCVSTGSSLIGSSRTPSRAAPTARKRRGHLRQRSALAEQPGAGDVGGEVAVAEREPVRLLAVCGELLCDREASRPRGPSPGSSWMPPPRVYMTVSRSGQTRSPYRRDVVGGVADDGDLGRRARAPRRRWCSRPRRKRAPPTPPASAVMRMPGILSVASDGAGRPARAGLTLVCPDEARDNV